MGWIDIGYRELHKTIHPSFYIPLLSLSLSPKLRNYWVNVSGMFIAVHRKVKNWCRVYN